MSRPDVPQAERLAATIWACDRRPTVLIGFSQDDRPAGRPRWCRSQLAGSVCHHCRFAFVVSKGVTELVADGRAEPVLE